MLVQPNYKSLNQTQQWVQNRPWENCYFRHHIQDVRNYEFHDKHSLTNLKWNSINEVIYASRKSTSWHKIDAKEDMQVTTYKIEIRRLLHRNSIHHLLLCYDLEG